MQFPMATVKKNALYKHDSAGSFSITGNQLNRVYVRARDYAKLYWSTYPVLFRPDTVHNRFPLKNNNLKKITFLNPEKVKRGNINSLVDVVRLFPNLVKHTKLQAIDTEWTLLRNNGELNNLDDIQVFWHQVITYGNVALIFLISMDTTKMKYL
jgi:hypothetical protein